jgi:hypothetical protein
MGWLKRRGRFNEYNGVNFIELDRLVSPHRQALLGTAG